MDDLLTLGLYVSLCAIVILILSLIVVGLLLVSQGEGDLLASVSSAVVIISAVVAVLVHFGRNIIKEIGERRNLSRDIHSALNEVLEALKRDYQKQFILEFCDKKYVNQMLDYNAYSLIFSKKIDFLPSQTQKSVHTIYHKINDYNLLIVKIRDIEDSTMPVAVTSSMTRRYYKALDTTKAELLGPEGVEPLMKKLERQFKIHWPS